MLVSVVYKYYLWASGTFDNSFLYKHCIFIHYILCTFTYLDQGVHFKFFILTYVLVLTLIYSCIEFEK